MPVSRYTGGPSSTEDHARYVQLCAFFTSGTLTPPEWEELIQHLAACEECREILGEYRAIAQEGMSRLASSEAAAGLEERGPWAAAEVKQRIMTRLAGEGNFKTPFDERPDLLLTAPSKASRNQPASRYARQVFPYAAAILFGASLLGLSYRLGVRRGHESTQARQNAAQNEIERLRRQMMDLSSERTALGEQLAARAVVLDALSARARREASELARLRNLERESAAALTRAEAEDRQTGRDLEALRSERAAAEKERDLVARKLHDAQASLASTEADLETVRQQRQDNLLTTATLEARIDQLSARLKEGEQTLLQQHQFLAADRDIRELMGARDLYIADVFDVDRNGKTQKAFGRVFYTKGKSLIFYAFDLDRLERPRKASTYQAWGRRGPNGEAPLNMGVFYLDNEVNRRWVLRFDDPAALAQIDAVFVTDEPRGGSLKPRGKQLLYAYLRSAPNHP